MGRNRGSDGGGGRKYHGGGSGNSGGGVPASFRQGGSSSSSAGSERKPQPGRRRRSPAGGVFGSPGGCGLGSNKLGERRLPEGFDNPKTPEGGRRKRPDDELIIPGTPPQQERIDAPRKAEDGPGQATVGKKAGRERHHAAGPDSVTRHEPPGDRGKPQPG